jgi:hypothetical protein
MPHTKKFSVREMTIEVLEKYSGAGPWMVME